MRYLTACDVPNGVERQVYCGLHLSHARDCLRAGLEDNAASWMWLDHAELDAGFSPVAGTLKEGSLHGIDGILYVDARDVAESLVGIVGSGI